MNPATQTPTARIQTRRTFSIIWVVPVVALLIGGWMAFKAWSEKGPEITIRFETAEGLEANKTRIKFKDVEIGTVTHIELNRDLSGVVVTAQMHNDTKTYLTDATRFWVVRARVAAGEVSGLGTLFSGAYIGCSPSLEGQPQRQFTGLDKPPIVTEGQPGRHFVLESNTLGSLDLGSPVYYRGIEVGQVVSYDFDEEAESVLLKVFIHAPYHKKVLNNTRFWNASGIDLSMDATGIRVDTQSLVSIMLGGVAFSLREHDLPGQQAEQNSKFMLYPDQESSHQDNYPIQHYYLLHFDQNVRGLSPGAPVEIKGIRIGEVVSVALRFETKSLDFQVPVLIMLEPQRMNALTSEPGKFQDEDSGATGLPDEQTRIEHLTERIRRLVEKGLRAQLQTDNLLTGQLFIDLDFYPEAPPATLEIRGEHTVFPTIDAPLEQIVHRVNGILANLEQIPFDQLGANLNQVLRDMSEVLNQIKALSADMNDETLPEVNTALQVLQQTLKGIDATLGGDSALNYSAGTVLKDLTAALRSIRSLLDTLERNPETLIFGKEATPP